MGYARTNGGTSSFDLNNDHVFATTGDMDTYFTTHPDELVANTYCSVNGTLYKYANSAWVAVSELVKGDEGTSGSSCYPQYSEDNSSWHDTYDNDADYYIRMVTVDADGDETYSEGGRFIGEEATSATTDKEGIVQLAGDLAGESSSVTVSGINGVEISKIYQPSSGRILTSTSKTECRWDDPINPQKTLNIEKSNFTYDANYFLPGDYPGVVDIEAYAKAVKVESCMISYTWTADDYDASLVYWIDVNRDAALVYFDDGPTAVSSSGVITVVAGDGVEVDNTDPTNPVVSSSLVGAFTEEVFTTGSISQIELTSPLSVIEPMTLIRSGNIVQFVWMQVIDMSTLSDGTVLFNIPKGYRPMISAEHSTTLINKAEIGSGVFYFSSEDTNTLSAGDVQMWGCDSDNEYYRISGTYITNDTESN